MSFSSIGTTAWGSAAEADFFKAAKGGNSDAKAYSSLNEAWKAAMAKIDSASSMAWNSCCDSYGDY